MRNTHKNDHVGKLTTYLLATVCLIVSASLATAAEPGDLDLTFGNGGTLTDWNEARATSIAIQPDGKLIVAGAWTYEYALARYNPDGSIDTTFGNGTGKVIAGSAGAFAPDIAVALQPDGKILLAGLAYYGDLFDIGLDVIRYNSDGSPDTTFSDNGHVNLTASGGLMFNATWVLIQSDGKIIAGAGERIYRLNPNGSLDTTFGTGGEVDPPGTSWAYASAIQPDGKIVIAGPRWISVGIFDFRLARFNQDGSPDAAFGSGGVAEPPMGSIQSCPGSFAPCSVYDLAIQTDGKLIVAGQSRLVRYNENGTLDTEFGSGAVATPPLVITRSCSWNLPCSGYGLAIQIDGKLVITGTSNNDFAVARYSREGRLDRSFGGGDGLTTIDFNNSIDNAFSMALDNKRRVVIVGSSSNGQSSQFALARLSLCSGAERGCL